VDDTMTKAAMRLDMPEADTGGGSFASITQAASRAKWTLCAFILVGGGLGYVIASIIPPVYEAEAVIAIDYRPIAITSDQETLNAANGSAAPVLDSLGVRTEVEALRSFAITDQVIKDLDLSRYDGAGFDLSALASRFLPVPEAWLDKLSGLFNPAPAVEDRNANFVDPATLRAREWLARNVTITTDGRSYTINVRSRAASRELAADIPNTYSAVYLRQLEDRRTEAVAKAKQWLTIQEKNARSDLADAEALLHAFRTDNGIAKGVTASGTNVATEAQTLSELALELERTSATLSQKKILQEQLAAVGSVSPYNVRAIAELTNSDSLHRLLDRDDELLQKQAAIVGNSGPNFPALASLRVELREVDRELQLEAGMATLEVDRTVQGLENHRRFLSDRLADTKQELEKLDSLQGQEQRLEGVVDAARDRFKHLLTRDAELEDLHGPNQIGARVLSAASVPRNPGFPNKRLFGLLGAAVAVAGFAVYHYLRDGDASSYGSVEELSRNTGLTCLGMVPENNGRQALAGRSPEPDVLQNECLRTIAVRLGLYRPNGPKVVLITSSTSGEGKTYTAKSLGRMLALDGKKCLIIDGDLRNPRIEIEMQDEHCLNLVSMLGTDQKVNPALLATGGGRDLCIVSGTSRIGSPHKLLTSDRMTELVAESRKLFDVVLIDAPPVLPVSDALLLSSFADVTILVAQWAKTRRSFVRRALDELADSFDGRIYTALTRVNPKKLQAAGRGLGSYG
jgi:capsular exopolysaccharide synthesis family protein